VFERFTDRARQVVVQGQAEARALNHDYIGTEHLLLGLLLIEDGAAAKALGSLEVTVEVVRGQIARIVGVGDEATAGQIPFTPRAKRVLELALREALSLGCNYIGTEHILLGLTRENDGVAAQILLELGAPAERIRAELESLLDTGAGSLEAPPKARRLRRARPMPAPGVHGGRVCWEYRVERRAAQIDQDWLNELGAEGWELVDISGDTFVFKRRASPGSLRAAG
jgi:ATP-dependent Clp protease ATP-binding subunit ClpA